MIKNRCSDIVAVDAGSGDKFCIHGFDGPIPRPRVGGSCDAEKTANLFADLLSKSDIVVESPTVGSSGIERDSLTRIVESSPYILYVMSPRVVKNRERDRKNALIRDLYDHPDLDEDELESRIKTIREQGHSDADSARIIYEIAVTKPDSLSVWSPKDWNPRRYKSVRPYDKRGYKGPEVDRLMELLPDFGFLNLDQQVLLGKNHFSEYSRSRALPFAMAMEEDGAQTRDGYERIIGLWSNGFPCFYRRNVEDSRQEVAKFQTGASKGEEISEGERKKSWRAVRPAIRRLYYMMNHVEDFKNPTLF